MQVIENEWIVCVDVDKTLVAPDPSGSLQLTNPYSNSIDYYKVLEQHVELLRQYKGRGMFVVVWSAAGVQWCKTVVDALGLDFYVDMIQTKPSKLVDDMPPEQVFTTRIFLNE